MAADNISNFYNVFSKKYNDFGNEDEFRGWLGKASREDVDKLYGLFNKKYNDFGSADDMISYLGWTDPSQQGAAAPADTASQSPAPAAPAKKSRASAFNERVRQYDAARGYVPGTEDAATEAWAKEQAARRTKETGNEELRKMVDERKANVARQKREESAAARAQAEENMDFFEQDRQRRQGGDTVPLSESPYTPDELKIESIEDLQKARESVREYQAVVDEYEAKKAEYENHMKEFSNLRGDVRGVDLHKYDADRDWLDRNKAMYMAAKERVDEVEALGGQNILPAAKEELASAIEANRQAMPELSPVTASGSDPFGGNYASMRSEEGVETSYREDADKIYGMAERTLNQGSKYDEGYGGNELEQLATAARQYVQGGANNFDLANVASLGLTEGKALYNARRAGDHYNEIINSTIKDLGYTDAQVGSLMKDLDDKAKKMEPVAERLAKSGAEIEAMQKTLDDMVARGADESEIRAYASELNKKINAYNKTYKDEYEPLYAGYQEDREKYDEVASAVEAALRSGLTGGEEAILDAVEKYTRAKVLREKDVSKASQAGAGFEQTLEFMLDFILTGGIAKAGTKAATKLTMRHLERKLGKEGLAKLAAKEVIKPTMWAKVATDLGVAGVRTAILVPRNLKTYGEQIAEYSGRDDLGRFQFDRSKLNAFFNTGFQNLVEYWSEGFGEYFAAGEAALFRKVTGRAPKQAIGRTLMDYRGSVGRFLDNGKFDGQLNEMLEEVVGSSFNALAGWLSSKIDPEGPGIGDKTALSEFMAGDNLATTFLSFLPLSAIGAATNIKAYKRMKDRYDRGVAGLNPFLGSGAIDREELESLAANIKEMTPEQVKDRIVEIADKARESVGGKLPGDFVQNIMGYLEGTFSMDLRHDEWEDSQEKMAVVNAYTSNYERPNTLEAWDLAQEEQNARSIASDAGFTDEELDQDSYVLAQDAAQMRESDPGRSQVLMGYATAKAARNGLRDGYDEAGRRRDAEFESAVRANLDMDGNIMAATMQVDGQPTAVYVTSKDAKIGPDGTVTTPSGPDGIVTYRDSWTGEQKTVKASELSNAETYDTDSFIRDATAADMDVRNRMFEAAENTVSLAGQSSSVSRMQGQTVVVRRGGVYVPVKVERMTDNGMGVVISSKDRKALQGIAMGMGMQVPAGQYLEAPVARLWPLLSREEDGSLTTMVPEGAETRAAEGVPEVEIIPDTEYTIDVDGVPTKVDVDQANETEVWYSYTDGEGNRRTGAMAPYEFREKILSGEAPAAEEQAPVEEAPAAQPAPAQTQTQQPSFPVDETTGNKVYDHPTVTPQAAYDEIYRGVEPGSKNEANRNKFVDAKADQAAAAVGDAQNRVAKLEAEKAIVDQWELPDGEEIDAFDRRQQAERKKFDDEIAAIRSELPELERRASHWNSVRDMAAQRTQPAPAPAQEATAAEEAPATGKPARKRLPKSSKKAIIARANQWKKRTGAKVKIAKSLADVDNKEARELLEKGELVAGWYDRDTGNTVLYIPNIWDEEDLDRTFIHEVISHKGLRELLGDDVYNGLCDRVWDELMTDGDREKWLAYNSHLEGTERGLRRAAADEYIAHFSETLGLADNRNAFERFVDWVMDLLGISGKKESPEEIGVSASWKALGTDTMTRDVLAELLRDSLSRYESARNAKPLSMESLTQANQDALRKKGLTMEGGAVMDEQQSALKRETGYKTPNELDMESNPIVGDVRMSKTTLPAWAQNYMTYADAKEHVVKVLENLSERMSTDQLVNWIVPGGVYKYGEKSSGSKAGPLRTNIEYIVTFDMDTSCPRSLQYLEYVKKIESQIGRPMTQTEMIQLIEMMRTYNQQIPCTYCYCENKRQALKQYYHDFMTARRAVVNAKTDDEALDAMYGHETTKAARESRDPAVALTDAAYKVFKRWRSGDVKYNPTLKQLWGQYRNDRNVILTVLDDMLEDGRINTLLTDTTIAKHLCQELRIEDKLAQKAAEDIVGEWKWNRIEDRPHDDFKRIEDEDDLVVGEETLSLWREMTAYGKSASQAKNVLRYVPYTDELKTLSQKDRDYINGMGGLRMHSSNDFRIDYVLDYFQFMADMAVNHMFGHTYTKSPEFVRIFGNSGYKINMSIAAYEDSRGIHPNPHEGFDWAEAKRLREQFPNAGVMLMATSDAQVQMALDSDWIDMFIPFHASGLPKAVWYNMRHWTDYSSMQNERFLNGEEMRSALEADGIEVPKGASAEEVEQMYIDHFHIRVERYTTGKKAGKRISPHFLPGPTIVDGVSIPGHNNDYETYIRLCREWGVHPRFYGLKVKDNTPEGGGREVDITEHPAYMKCIKETARTDSPQTAIQFNFDEPSEALGGKSPIDYAFEELQVRAAAEMETAGSPVRSIYESYKQDPYGIVPQFIDTIIKHKEETGKDYPLDYLTPDSREWAMTERGALEDAYKDFDTIPYHPHVYDAEGNLVMTPETEEQKEVQSDGSWTMFRKVTDPEIIEWFNKAPKTTGFRTVAKFGDDYGSPMAGQLGAVKGKKAVSTSTFSMNEIEQSEENPDIADENGKVALIKPKRKGEKLTNVGSVDYNPYIHLRLDKINRQFKDAWKRDNLVYIESEVPIEEVPDFRGEKNPDHSKSPYHAEKAALPVGIHDWNGGPLMLSRYDRPIREVPWKEVADAWAADEKFKKDGVHFDIVPPQMRDLLTERGIEIIEPHKGMGQDCIDAYNAWKNGKNGPDGGGTRFRKVTPEQDREYMAAVESGDMETAQRMADEAAKAAGYSIKAFHGTGAKEGEIKVFDDVVDKWSEAPYGSFWFASNKLAADTYNYNTPEDLEETGDPRSGLGLGSTMQVYLKMENPYIIDAKGANWDHIPDKENRSFGFSETNGLAERAMDQGYDGVIIKNVTDTGWGEYEGTKREDYLTDDYAVFSPNQIKSAEPVVRDDNGNVIPLSQRFNPENNDIRFRRQSAEERRIESAERDASIQTLGAMPQVIKVGTNHVTREQMPDGHKTDKGYYDADANQMYVCLDNVADERDAIATVFHETVGYKGLRELLGQEFDNTMARVYGGLDAAGRAWVNAYMARNGLNPGDAGIVRGMEEYLAGIARRDGGTAIQNVGDVLGEVVDMLFGTEDFAFTPRELEYIVRASYEHAKDPNWLNTPAGRAKNTLMKRELGINETDPNKPTDPDGSGVRFRREDSGMARADYEDAMQDWRTAMVLENQNADLPVKIGMEKAMKEVGKKDLAEEEDYLTRHNLSSSRAETEAHNFMLFHYTPLIDKVREVQRRITEGKSHSELRDAYQRILDYMYAVSGLERNEWDRNNGGEQKDWSGLTSLMGRPKEEWQEAEADAKKMIAVFRTDLRDSFWTDGKSGAEAQDEADKMLDDLWKAVRSCTDFSLEHAYKYGLLSREEFERLHGTASKPRMWNYYLPLRGFAEKTAEDEFSYSSLAGHGDGATVMKHKGRWTEADNPLANILNIAQREIVQGNENWARQALLRFTINLGKNSLLSERNPWYVKKAGTKNSWVLAYPEPTFDPVTNQQTGTESIEDFEARMNQLKAKGEARQGRKGLKLDQIMANKGHRNQHLIHVKVGGSDRMIWVNGNPALARAVSGFGKTPNYEWLRKASRALSNLFTTYSLDFTAKNLIRDSIYSRVALLVKEDRHYRWKFFQNWWKNFGFGAFAFPMVKLAAEWDSGKLQSKPESERTEREQMFIDFMTDGGQTGYTVVRSVEKLKKDLLKTMDPSWRKKAVDAMKVDVNGVTIPLLGVYSWGVRTLNEAFELLTRFTTYETSRRMGRTGQRAAYDAKEISVNFNRRGAQSGDGSFWGNLAAYLGGTHYFYNAGVQGFDNFLRLYKTNKWVMGPVSVGIISMGAITPFLNSLLAGADAGNGDGGDDDWYWNLPEWVRRNNIVIGCRDKDKVDKDGNVVESHGASYLALPLPVEFRALYGLGDIAASAWAYGVYGKEHGTYPNRSFGRIAGDILSTAAAILPFNPVENYTASGNFGDAVIRSFAPDVAMPLVDIATNRDYTGRALMKENPFTKVVPKNQGAYASTPRALVEMCQQIGAVTGVDIAPGVVRDVMNSYGGGFYRFAEDISRRLYTDVDRPKRWDDIPFLSGFTGHIDEDRSNTYVSNVLNEYQRLSQKNVVKMNLTAISKDITEKMAYEDKDSLPTRAQTWITLHKKDYEIGKIYYFGMKDKGTGEFVTVNKVHQTGKSAGKQYKSKEEIKIPGVDTLRKRWKDARDYWAALPENTEDEKSVKAEAYKDVTNAWHEYCDAQANLAEELLNYEYGNR